MLDWLLVEHRRDSIHMLRKVLYTNEQVSIKLPQPVSGKKILVRQSRME